MSAFSSDLFAGRRFYVVGLGKNGLPAARRLAAMGAEVEAWDDKAEVRAVADGVALRDPATGDFDFDALVLSPGIPHHLPRPHLAAERARRAGVPILCDVELLYQAVRKTGSRARFAGITGTNGKSTTTALLAHVLQRAGRDVAAGANLGPAALSLPLLGDGGIYVLEMSSYLLERLDSLRFDVAVMLNLSADHIDRHGDMSGYAMAKRAIFDRQTARDLAVIGIDDVDSRTMATWLHARPTKLCTVSGEVPADVWCDHGTLHDVGGAIADLRKAVALPGTHNAQNAAAAAAMALYLGLPRTAIAEGLLSYPGLPHRQQRVGTVEGVTFINDSKATNADSAARALVCHDRLVWIAGGMQKEGGITPLAGLFPRIAHVLLIGRDARDFATTLATHGVPYEVVGTLERAVPAAFEVARRIDAKVVLLSPACASWDQFSGYDQRGERFAQLVDDLRRAA